MEHDCSTLQVYLFDSKVAMQQFLNKLYFKLCVCV